MTYRESSNDTDTGEQQYPRVMMVVPQYPYPVLGGLERQSHELGKALKEIGINVQVISGKTSREQPHRDLVEGIPVFRIHWPRKKWIRFIRTPIDLFHILIRERNSYDVVHLHQFSWFALFTVVVSKMLNKPVLIKMPNGGGMFGLSFMTESRLGWVKLIIFKRTDAIVAITLDSFNELTAFGYPSNRILFAPNGIRVSEVDKATVKNINDTRLGRIVFVGSIIKEKGVFELIQAWCDIVKSVRRPVQLEFWGDGPQEDEIRRLCRGKKIEDSVIFRGHVDTVREKLVETDIFVLPSISEGNSNAILEAMAAGLPVVSTDVGGTPMQVGIKGAQFLVRPGDKGALSNCLLKLIEDDKLRAEVGNAMYQRARVQFDILKIAHIYKRAYSLLVSGKRDKISEVNNFVMFEK